MLFLGAMIKAMVSILMAACRVSGNGIITNDRYFVMKTHSLAAWPARQTLQ